jgi:tRNA (guanosine-2'-O-)-methyltransferase
MTRTEQNAREEMEALLALARQAGVDPAEMTFAGRPLDPAQVVALLEPHLSDRRRARIEDVLDGRTYTVATVVEGIVNTGNVNAVMRTAEALGYQGFHIITGDAVYKDSRRTSVGAEKWLDVWHWAEPAVCVDYLHAEGYTVVATHLDDAAVPVEALDFTEKTALVFGNELHGVSPELLALADRRCILPMTGFVKSYNISVAAAVSLYHAYRDRLGRQGRHGDLTAEQRAYLQALFYLRGTRNAREIIEEGLARRGR